MKKYVDLINSLLGRRACESRSVLKIRRNSTTPPVQEWSYTNTLARDWGLAVPAAIFPELTHSLAS